ncbi:MAG TPA: MFS transporter, partial [Actinomycetota bacterium]|nr:MFS transporter [Actinomycetota bacterium]
MRTSLGPDFAKLWTASTVSNLGDGVTLVAGPLLAATLTRDPLLVAAL